MRKGEKEKSIILDHWKAKTTRSTRKIGALIKAGITPPCTSASLFCSFKVTCSEKQHSTVDPVLGFYLEQNQSLRQNTKIKSY